MLMLSLPLANPFAFGFLKHQQNYARSSPLLKTKIKLEDESTGKGDAEEGNHYFFVSIFQIFGV